MASKYFTIGEANAALTLVRPVTRDLVTKYLELMKLKRDVELMRTHGTFESEEELRTLAEKAERLAQSIVFHRNEIIKIGCELQDSELGLIDFPCHYEGRIVHLCWQFGEPKILAWHEYNAGFENRKPIDRSFYNAPTTGLC